MAQGLSQIPEIDYYNTFLSVAKFTMLQVFLTTAAMLNLKIHQINVVGAYLKADLDEEIYMRALKNIGKARYWKLCKAIYGLKQAGQKWKEQLHNVLMCLGFKQSWANNCLYILRSQGKIVLIVLVYVDDMAVAKKDLHHIIAFKMNMSKQFGITNLSEMFHMLGLQISYNRNNHTIQLDQLAYINSILNHFSMTTCHEIATPLAMNHNLSLLQSPKTAKEAKLYVKYTNDMNYLSMVGSLLYVTQTCLDIQFTVSLVAQFVNNSEILHLTAYKQILWYLKGTKDYSLILRGLFNNEVNLVG